VFLLEEDADVCGYAFYGSVLEESMLGGSLVATAWRVLRLQMEETPSRYGGKQRIYGISSRGQPTRGGPPAWGLGVRLTTPHRKK
jgi:hypothetical protein